MYLGGNESKQNEGEDQDQGDDPAKKATKLNCFLQEFNPTGTDSENHTETKVFVHPYGW